MVILYSVMVLVTCDVQQTQVKRRCSAGMELFHVCNFRNILSIESGPPFLALC